MSKKELGKDLNFLPFLSHGDILQTVSSSYPTGEVTGLYRHSVSITIYLPSAVENLIKITANLSIK